MTDIVFWKRYPQLKGPEAVSLLVSNIGSLVKFPNGRTLFSNNINQTKYLKRFLSALKLLSNRANE